MKKLSLVLAAFCLCACQPTEPADEGTPTLTAQTVLKPTGETLNEMKVYERLTSTPQDDGTLIISGTAPDALAAGWTQGVSFVIGGEAEEALSGQRVKVKVLAKSASGEPVDMNVAYSTNEVGNSGWQTFSLGDAYQVYEFEFDVNPMENGNGDYIGILPVSGPVQVAAVGYDILPAAGAPE